MIKEEQILKSRYGTQSPFRVPEGYFDELASRVMASVPESQPALDMQSESASQGARIVPMWRRAVVSKVAVIAGVVLLLGGASIGIGTSLSSRQAGKSVASGGWASVMHSEDNSFDEAADYAMLDNQDIYASLLSESSGF